MKLLRSMSWSCESELERGTRIKIKGFPKDHKVQCFQVVVSTHRTDFVATKDLAQVFIQATQQACGWWWKIEQLHGEGKQVTELEACQYRKAWRQRNPSVLPFWFGCSSTLWQSEQGKRFTSSNVDCLITTFASNANTHLSKWLLRKSCYQIANLVPQPLSQRKKRKVNLLPPSILISGQKRVRAISNEANI